MHKNAGYRQTNKRSHLGGRLYREESFRGFWRFLKKSIKISF